MSNPLAKMTTAMPLITTAENNNNEDLLVKAVPALAAPASDTSCTSSTTVSSLTTTTQPSVSSSAGPLHRSSSTEPEEEEDPVVPQVTYVSAIPPPLSNISLQEEDSVRVDAAAAEEACLCGRHGTEQVVRINEDSILSKSTRIGWGSIVIYQYPIVPGEHADCLYGPPVRNKRSFHLSSASVTRHLVIVSLTHTPLSLLVTSACCPCFACYVVDDCLGGY
jgi:hypothetical protein